MFDYLILGSGFRSCIAALMASKLGYKVALIDDQKTICKFIKPGNWNGYTLDKGPQFFDDFSKKDWDLMNYLLDEDLFHDLQFKYASYIGGAIDTNFAIPAWSNCKDLDMNKIFKDLIEIKSAGKKDFKNFDDFIKNDGGHYLYPYLYKLCNKLLQTNPEDISCRINKMITFTGRKKLFDNDKSIELKKNEIYDKILAAKKKYVGEPRYNLYAKSGNLEDIRLSIETSLKKNNVYLFLGNKINSFDIKSNQVVLDNNEKILFNKIVFADNIQRTEFIYKNTNELFTKTFSLPQVFVFIKATKKQFPEFNYVMNYELSHITSRFTNFGNYASPKSSENGVICAEIPTKLNFDIWKNKDKYVPQVIDELNQVYGKKINVLSSMAMGVSSTYKVPLVGFDESVEKIINDINENSDNNAIVPDPYVLTRKNAIDSLRPYFND